MSQYSQLHNGDEKKQKKSGVVFIQPQSFQQYLDKPNKKQPQKRGASTEAALGGQKRKLPQEDTKTEPTENSSTEPAASNKRTRTPALGTAPGRRKGSAGQRIGSGDITFSNASTTTTNASETTTTASTAVTTKTKENAEVTIDSVLKFVFVSYCLITV